MSRRILLAITVVCTMLIAFPTSALGWADNSVTNSVEDRYWGTHDWIVWQAYVAAGQPAWFDWKTAVTYSDYPDRNDSSKVDHVYHVDPSFGGAPHRVTNLYQQALNQYKAGDYAGASKTLGLLSHYYSDACVPFHTENKDVRKEHDLYHDTYELQVKSLASKKTDKVFLQLRERRAVTNVRAKTISSAYVANKQLDPILDNWPSGGIGNSTVRSATKVSLSEAVNGFADIIAAVPTGKGVGPAPYKYSVYESFRRYVAKYGKANTTARVVDSSGRPIRGVKVTFTWEFDAGTRKHVRYTNPDGYVYSWQETGAQSWYRPFDVSAQIATTGSTLNSKDTWLMTTPVLATGEPGFKTTLSNRYPVQNTYVTAKAKATSTSGKPVPNLRVKFVWKHYSRDVVTYATTNSNGNAYSKRNIGNAKSGYKVYVVSYTQAGGHNRRWTTSFIPKPPPKIAFTSAPRFSTYTHTYGKTYKVWGYFKPKHETGSTEMKVLAYRKTKQADGTYKYIYKKSFSTKVSNPSGSSYSKYTGYVELPSKGKWRLRVRHLADTKNAKSYSSYRYVEVK